MPASAAAPAIVRRSFDTEHRRVSYLTADGAPAAETILLIHGAGVSARTWVSQLRGLSDTLRPIAIDLPGHRESDPVPHPTLTAYAETAYRALERLGTGPAFVAGHSLGGAVAQLLSLRHPAVVKGLILVSTCARIRVDPDAHALLGFVPTPLRRAIFLWALRKTLLAPSASSEAIELTLEEIRRCRPETIQHDTEMGRAMNMEEVARALRVPTLVLGGERDRLTPPALSEELAAMIDGARVRLIPHAGHMLPLEAPAAVNEAIRDFVGLVARPPAPAEGWRRSARALWRRCRDLLRSWAHRPPARPA